MTYEQVLEHSFERLLSMVRAKHRQRTRTTLDLAQLIVAGSNNRDAWLKKQQQMIDELNFE